MIEERKATVKRCFVQSFSTGWNNRSYADHHALLAASVQRAAAEVDENANWEGEEGPDEEQAAGGAAWKPRYSWVVFWQCFPDGKLTIPILSFFLSQVLEAGLLLVVARCRRTSSETLASSHGRLMRLMTRILAKRCWSTQRSARRIPTGSRQLMRSKFLTVFFHSLFVYSTVVPWPKRSHCIDIQRKLLLKCTMKQSTPLFLLDFAWSQFWCIVCRCRLTWLNLLIWLSSIV